MRSLRYLTTVLALAGLVVTGCSSSSGTSGLDSGADGIAPDAKTDGKADAKTDGKADAKTDGKADAKTGKESGVGDSGGMGDGMMMTDSGRDGGPCDFAAFVLNLIKTDTNAMATPSTDLGQACTDKQDQSQFASLF